MKTFLQTVDFSTIFYNETSLMNTDRFSKLATYFLNPVKSNFFSEIERKWLTDCYQRQICFTNERN